MLLWAQIPAVIDHGQQIVRDLEHFVSEQRKLQAQEEEAFASGSTQLWQEIADKRRALQVKALASWDELRSLMLELGAHAEECVSQYRKETGGDLPEEDTVPLLPDVQAGRLQNCREYLDGVTKVVQTAGDRLVEFRRGKLRTAVDSVSAMLKAVEAEGDRVPAVSDYLASEAYLDLPLEDARRRLEQELRIVVGKSEELGRARSERERARRLAEARAALTRIQELPDALDHDLDYSHVKRLSTEGTQDDRAFLWRTLATLPESISASTESRLTELCVQTLEEDLPRAECADYLVHFDKLPSSVLASIGHAFLESPRQARVMAALEALDDQELVLSKVRLLKQWAPEASFELLRRFCAIPETAPLVPIASWFQTNPRKWTGLDEAILWLADVLESQHRWIEATICFENAETIENSLRASLAFMVAVAECDSIAITFNHAFSEYFWAQPGIFSRNDVAVVGAASLVVLGERGEGDPREFLSALEGSLGEAPAFQTWIGCVLKAWPTPLPHYVEEVGAKQAALRDRIREVDAFLATVREPAGKPSLVFYRDWLLPAWREIYRRTGLDGLARLDSVFVQNLLRGKSQALNPTAVRAMERHSEELAGLAKAAIVVQEALGNDQRVEFDRSLASLITREADLVPQESRAVRWAYAMALKTLASVRAKSVPGSACEFSVESVRAVLLSGNPLVDLYEGGVMGTRDLLDAVMERLRHGDRVDEWRTTYACDHKRFDIAEGYVAQAAVSIQGHLREIIQARKAKLASEVQTGLELLIEFTVMVESGDEKDLLLISMEEVSEALAAERLRDAEIRLEEALALYSTVEANQTSRRKEYVREAESNMVAGVQRLWSVGDRSSEDLRRLLLNAVRTVSAPHIYNAKPYTDALGAALAGRGFDRELLDLPPEWEIAVANPFDPDQISAPPDAPTNRQPVSFDAFFPVVRMDVENLLRAESTGSIDRDQLAVALSTSVSGRERMKASAILFAEEKRKNGVWEEPLLTYLVERAQQASRAREYLRASEYYQSAVRLAYHACDRLSRPIDMLRLAAMSFAKVRLLHVQHAVADPSRTKTTSDDASPSSWSEIARRFLLCKAQYDLAEVCGSLLEDAPNLAGECLDHPLSTVPPLAKTLLRAIVQRGESLSAGQFEVVRRIAKRGLPEEQYLRCDEALEQIRKLLDRDARRPSRGVGRDADIDADAIVAALKNINLDAAVAEVLAGVVTSCVTAEPSDDELPEGQINFSAITKSIYADAWRLAPEIPIHVRVSYTGRSHALRNAVINYRAIGDAVEVTSRSSTVNLKWLHDAEPEEVPVFVRRRGSESGLESASDDPKGECLLEVTDVGLRRGGVIRSGAVPYRGRRLAVSIIARYPHTNRPNPYTPGPAIKDLALIKGRDEETAQVMRTLRAAHQDNVPLVWGGRRIGKSTLLYRLRLDPEVRRHYEAVPCDMEGLVRQHSTTISFVRRLMGHIAEELQGTPAGRVAVPDVRAHADVLDAFQSYLDALRHAIAPRSLLLMFDEMEFFLDYLAAHRELPEYGNYDKALHEDIVRVLRHNMQHKDNISFLIAGTRRLLEMTGQVGERLFQLPVPIEVGELREEDARKLVIEPIADTYSMSTAAVERVLWLTSRHPYLLQAICHEMFAFMQDHRLSTCACAEVDKVVEERMLAQPTYFEFQLGALRKDKGLRSSALAVAVLNRDERRCDLDAVSAYVQLETAGVVASDPHVAVKRLVDEGVLLNWRGEYRFRVPLVGQYLVATAERWQQ